MKISVLIPTRARPERIKHTLISMQCTAAEPKDIDVWLATDDDDPNPVNIDELQKLVPHLKVHELKIPRQPYLGVYYNQVYKRCSGDIIGVMSDDITFRYRGWDTANKNAFIKNPIFLTHSEHNSKVFTHFFVSRKSVDLLGYVVPEYFKHGYLDWWITDIYRDLDLHKHIATITHEHHHAKPDLYDSTYKDREGLDEADKEIYDVTIHERQEAAEKLKEYINEQDRKTVGV